MTRAELDALCGAYLAAGGQVSYARARLARPKVPHAFQVGDRVRYSHAFLQRTSDKTVDHAPCSWGPHARGFVLNEGEPKPRGRRLVPVRWDDGSVSRVRNVNLRKVR